MVEILVAVIGLVGVIISSLIGWISKEREKTKRIQAERELLFQNASLDFAAYMEEWNETEEMLKSLFEETPIDRFIILRAWNGLHNPRWTTAVYQMRREGQKLYSYVHFELDDDYVWRIQQMYQKQILVFKTEEMPPSLIKDVYENEGVLASLWSFIDSRHHAYKDDSRSITYCSFASLSSDEISQETATRCRIISSRLKGLAINFYSREPKGTEAWSKRSTP